MTACAEFFIKQATLVWSVFDVWRGAGAHFPTA